MLSFSVAGVGVWGNGLTTAQDLIKPPDGEAVFTAPKPEAIPPRERRRAGTLINLAVEVAHQACEQAGCDKSDIPSVFASAMGDTAITDYMCDKLCREEKLLSPTKFHNSVHNAASGYWTISAGNRAPSTFVGGFRHVVGSALLEAASQCQQLERPVLLVCYDLAVAAPFDDLVSIGETLAVALVLSPETASGGWTLTLGECENTQSMPHHPVLAARANANPAGPLLALAEAGMTSVGAAAKSLSFPVAESALHVLLDAL